MELSPTKGCNPIASWLNKVTLTLQPKGAGRTGGNPNESAKPPSLANMVTRAWNLGTAKQLTGQRLRARTRTEGRGWAPHLKGLSAPQTQSVHGLAGDQGGERPVSKTLLFVYLHGQQKGFWFLSEDRHPPAGIRKKEALALASGEGRP